ncbi:Abi family protein [Schaalia cardiffensis]
MHFVEGYDSEVPIWVATEFMTMGCLVSLLDLMALKDQR